MDSRLWKAGRRTSSAPAQAGASALPIETVAEGEGRYDKGQRPVRSAHFCTSGQFHAGRPPTVHDGSGMSPRCRQMSTVGRLTPSRSATSAMPTGSQFFMGMTVGKVLTDRKDCVDNHYMNTTTTTEPTQHCEDCHVGPFFYVPARQFPTLCLDCSADADRNAHGWSPENSAD